MKFKSFKLFGLALLLVGLGLVGFLRPGLASGTQAETPSPSEVMVLIPAGSFQMGDSFDEGESDERPVHTSGRAMVQARSRIIRCSMSPGMRP